MEAKPPESAARRARNTPRCAKTRSSIATRLLTYESEKAWDQPGRGGDRARPARCGATARADAPAFALALAAYKAGDFNGGDASPRHCGRRSPRRARWAGCGRIREAGFARLARFMPTTRDWPARDWFAATPRRRCMGDQIRRDPGNSSPRRSRRRRRERSPWPAPWRRPATSARLARWSARSGARRISTSRSRRSMPQGFISTSADPRRPQISRGSPALRRENAAALRRGSCRQGRAAAGSRARRRQQRLRQRQAVRHRAARPAKRPRPAVRARASATKATEVRGSRGAAAYRAARARAGHRWRRLVDGATPAGAEAARHRRFSARLCDLRPAFGARRQRQGRRRVLPPAGSRCAS